MDAQTEADDARIVLEPAGKTVYPEGMVRTPYGEKLALGGDTYDLLSKHGEGIADELEFHEHHCAWTPEADSWTIDAGTDSTRALKEALERNGHTFSGVAGEAAQAARELAPDVDGHTRWSSHGIRVRVTYESKQSGREMTKEGVVHGVDLDDSSVIFERDDGTTNKLEGNALFSTYSQYPFMGKVVRVEVLR
jgi:hypothetical protein